MYPKDSGLKFRDKRFEMPKCTNSQYLENYSCCNEIRHNFQLTAIINQLALNNTEL